MPNENKKEIDPNKFYSAKGTIDLGVLPWASRLTFVRLLNSDEKLSKIFNPIIEQKDVRKRFYIKGEYIIKFLELHEKGELNN